MLSRAAALFKPRGILLAAAILAPAVALSAYLGQIDGRLHRSSDAPARRYSELTGALRASPGRLSGDWPYSPDTRGRQRSLKGLERRNALVLRDKILNLAQDQPTAENRAQAALVNLADGRFEAAIDLLSEASRSAPQNSAILSDLAAVHLADGRARQSAIAYFHALASAEHALQIDPNLASARFNRALALESLGIGWEARRAWGRYQAEDPASPWADEARRRLLLARPRADSERQWDEARMQLRRGNWSLGAAELDRVVGTHRLQARLFGEEELLGGWAASWREGNPAEARRALDGAREFGTLLYQKSGDPLLTEAVLAIGRAQAHQPRAAWLAEAHRDYLNGLHAYASNDLPGSVALLSKARGLFLRGESPMSWWAAVQLANSLQRQGQYEQAKVLLREVQEKAPQSYLNLHGRASWILGVIAVIGSEYGLAYDSYERALTFYKRSGEMESVASLYALIAEYYYYTGDEDRVWENLVKSLSRLDNVPREKRDFILWCGSLAASGEGEPDLALLFHDELVSLAEESGDPASLAAVLHGRATAQAEAQRYDESLQDIGAAWAALKRVPRGGLSDTLTGDILLAESEIRRQRDSRSALMRSQQALALFRRTGYRLGLPRALLAQARAYIALNEPAHASSAITATLDEVSRQRLEILKSADRIEIMARMGKLFDEAAEYHLTVLRRPDLAYGFVEQNQALSLLDFPKGMHDARPAPARMSPRLEPGVIVLQFAVFTRRTCVWALWNGGWAYDEIAINQDELRHQIESFRSAILRDDRALIKELGASLYRRLFEVTLHKAPRHAVEVIIPSKYLYALPFAALTNPVTRKYLIEEHLMEIAPSSGIYLERLASAERRSGNSHRILLLGDPAFDQNVLPTLRRLPGSAAEVRRLATIFKGEAVVLDGEKATKGELLARVQDADILHLAAHAIVNPRDPRMSYLALAPQHDSGIFFASEFLEPRFRHLDLVFLAGCATAKGLTSGGEGGMSLARIFLASGASAVIGTLWDMPDRASSSGTERFYELLNQGLDASNSLREAQLSMIADVDPSLNAPVLWAGFVLTGAGRGVRIMSAKQEGGKS